MKITEVTKQINEVDLQTFMNRAREVLTTVQAIDLLNSIEQDYGGDPNRWLIQARANQDDWFQNPSNRAIRDKIFGVASGLGQRGEQLNDPVVNLDDVPMPTRRRGAANASTNVDIPLAPRVVGARPEGPAAGMPAARPGAARPEGPAAGMPAAAPAPAPRAQPARPISPTPGGPLSQQPNPPTELPQAAPAQSAPEPAPTPEPSAARPQPTRPGQETSGPDLSQITQTLRRGSRGEGVRVLQQSLGMSGNAVDGIFGPNTEAAVRQFQQNAGIQVDGVVGRQTLSALQNRAATGSAGATDMTPGRIGNAPASAPAQQQTVDPQAAAAVARTDLNGRRRIGTDAGDGMVWIVGNTNALTRVMPNDPRVAAQRAAVAARNESKKVKTNSLVEGIKKLAGISKNKKLNEASMNISLNADSSAEVAELLRIMQLAGAGGSKPVDVDMINQPDSHTGGCGCSKCAAKMSAPEPSMGDMIRMISSEEEDTDGKFTQASTAPDEKYMNDVSASIPNGNDLNKKKNSYPVAAGGDNPMALESIKSKLIKALSEKKAKPDFLDMDKDGNKKEPMKKAIADKKKKTNEAEVEQVDEVSKKTAISAYRKRQRQADDWYSEPDDQKKADATLRRISKKFGSKTTGDAEHGVDIDRKGRGPRDVGQDYLFYKQDTYDRFAKPRTKKGTAQRKDYMKLNKGTFKKPPRFTEEAEVQTPSHELDDTARKATNIAQMIKRKINSGEKMDDMDYNQLAELGAILSRFGTSFGPQSMKDVMKHMIQYTDDRNEYGTGYPEFTVDRFKELLAMAKSKGESMVGEISDKTRSSYVKKANKSYDAAQASGDKKTMNKRGRGLDSAYDSKIRSDKKRRETNSKKGDYDYNFGYGESMVGEISKDLARNYYRKASKDIGDQARSANDYRGGSDDLKSRLDRTYNRDGSRTKPEDRERDRDTISKYDLGREKSERKVKNRATGIGRASKRM